MPFDEPQLAALRGELEPSANSARDLALTAQTPCLRRRALAIVGANPDSAAAVIGAESVHYGQSPFAIQIGERFERALTRDEFERLIEGLQEQLGFPGDGIQVVDLDREIPFRFSGARKRGTEVDVARRRRERTDSMLVAILSGPDDAPAIVRHPRLTLAVTDSVRDVEPDLLIAWPGRGLPRLGEIKSYVDLRHRTDLSDLAKTRQQLAVYFLALERAIKRLATEGRLADGTAALASLRSAWPSEAQQGRPTIRAVTVLRRPHSMRPVIGVEDVRRDVELVRRGLARTPATLVEILQGLPKGTRTLDTTTTIRALPTSYEPAWCLGNCPMAGACRDEAHRRNDPAFFGKMTRAVLAAAGDLDTAHALACGTRSPGEDPALRAFAERMRALRLRIDAARVAAGLPGAAGPVVS